MTHSNHSPSGNGRTSSEPHPGSSVGRVSASHRQLPALITGGAGFVGTNLASHLLEQGIDVLVFDSLSRPGVERNLSWLVDRYGSRVQVEISDVRDPRAVRWAVARSSAVFHLAAQVAVTTSLENPAEDFAVNARGTLNVLEACRKCADPPPLLFTSTNKVYGNLGELPLRRDGSCYLPADKSVREKGINEACPLDFHSPYGCSKGVADQYVLDYARCYRLPATVFRMSCIYGPHQCGTEDQGWVAHFCRRVLEDESVTLYGDGCQVRDILFVEDLIHAMLLTLRRIDVTAGRAFNVGGGPGNAISLLQIIQLLGELSRKVPELKFADWRQGDQRYYVSDTQRLQRTIGWRPQVDVREGVSRLYHWLEEDLRTRSDSTGSPLRAGRTVTSSGPARNRRPFAPGFNGSRETRDPERPASSTTTALPRV